MASSLGIKVYSPSRDRDLWVKGVGGVNPIGSSLGWFRAFPGASGHLYYPRKFVTWDLLEAWCFIPRHQSWF